MKKILLGSVITAAIIVGCANKDNALGEGGKKIDKKALQALSIQGAPNWVLNAGQGDMSAVGDAPIINGDLGFARTEALALARDELARQVGVEVNSALSRAAKASTSSSMQNSQIETLSEQITQQSTSQLLSGTKQTDTWITQDASRVFVLLKLSPENQAKLKANVKQQINKSKVPADIKTQALKTIDSEF
uniref:Lipoprotein LPP20-like domain-containing protein n=1 Tax=uncultured Helicobacter sp. TaxID=175537 RepID=A0A650EL99_9HELI|nr:hypothetical protein Helico5904_0650 [uncultured Helicobacter sp.]